MNLNRECSNLILKKKWNKKKKKINIFLQNIIFAFFYLNIFWNISKNSEILYENKVKVNKKLKICKKFLKKALTINFKKNFKFFLNFCKNQNFRFSFFSFFLCLVQKIKLQENCFFFNNYITFQKVILFKQLINYIKKKKIIQYFSKKLFFFFLKFNFKCHLVLKIYETIVTKLIFTCFLSEIIRKVFRKKLKYVLKFTLFFINKLLKIFIQKKFSFKILLYYQKIMRHKYKNGILVQLLFHFINWNK